MKLQTLYHLNYRKMLKQELFGVEIVQLKNLNHTTQNQGVLILLLLTDTQYQLLILIICLK